MVEWTEKTCSGQNFQWVENNPTNICIFPVTSVFLSPLTAFADVDADVAGG
jgi:hypothetical protein